MTETTISTVAWAWRGVALASNCTGTRWVAIVDDKVVREGDSLRDVETVALGLRDARALGRPLNC